MRVIHFCVATILSLALAAASVRAQVPRTEFRVDFRAGSAVIDLDYSDNRAAVDRIVGYLRSLKQDENIEIISVSFCGTASLEGSYEVNRRIAKQRLEALETMVRREVNIPDNIVLRDDNYIPWDDLKSLIAGSNPPPPARDEVISIIDKGGELVPYSGGGFIDSRIPELKAVDGGRAWQQLNDRFFADMRSASAVIVTFRKDDIEEEIRVDDQDMTLENESQSADFLEIPVVPAEEPEAVVEEAGDEEVGVAVEEEAETEPEEQPVREGRTRRLLVKTNAVGWALLNANAAAEIDIDPHWSFTLPLYHCGVNYFTYTVRFRSLGIQPEIRWWLREDNDGFFAGAHAGLFLYDYAFGGGYRYQDREGKTPAFGAGVSAGWRMPLTRDDRWRVEFSLGAGGYSLHYDKFLNVPNGRLADTVKRGWFGIDQAAVTFSYSFDLKKGGAR